MRTSLPKSSRAQLAAWIASHAKIIRCFFKGRHAKVITYLCRIGADLMSVAASSHRLYAMGKNVNITYIRGAFLTKYV
jgi:hypothetical protein